MVSYVENEKGISDMRRSALPRRERSECMEAMLSTKLCRHNLAFPMLDFGKTEAGRAAHPAPAITGERTHAF